MAERRQGRGRPGGERRGGERPGRRGDAPAERGLLYGRNPVHEALRAARRPVRRIWATAAAAREPWLAGASVPVEVVDAEEVEAKAGTTAHQGVCADVAPYPYADAARLLAAPDPFLVVLDEVQDPQNLGAIARTAECAGVTGLLIPERRSAEVTPAACKASAGAVEHLAIARVRNVADALLEAKEAGCWVYGAAADGVDHTTPDYRGGCVLVLGAEGRGLRPRVRDACDEVVGLPLRGRIDSLNVSAAAAVLIYGALQARLRA
ncbi:23S rRNA (guanosine(2251)-2'-O)-methyltransferase RlmB [Conexibacter sp. SYSU D00693]|uniref:23S rRNA (guanosine(2251)-2'-O)-methyltransferase RlmB n=1 Tax=Conexibacter sp. SYSU D00693 TaxID=2812560 RepID=UPI00196B55FC|nr:23S rRNA (guanosine(2251)-2'-O)-methyltransferase RlmB [Conexibacter sp. SYSU D00693]